MNTKCRGVCLVEDNGYHSLAATMLCASIWQCYLSKWDSLVCVNGVHLQGCWMYFWNLGKERENFEDWGLVAFSLKFWQCMVYLLCITQHAPWCWWVWCTLEGSEYSYSRWADFALGQFDHKDIPMAMQRALYPSEILEYDLPSLGITSNHWVSIFWEEEDDNSEDIDHEVHPLNLEYFVLNWLTLWHIMEKKTSCLGKANINFISLFLDEYFVFMSLS